MHYLRYPCSGSFVQVHSQLRALAARLDLHGGATVTALFEAYFETLPGGLQTLLPITNKPRWMSPLISTKVCILKVSDVGFRLYRP